MLTLTKKFDMINAWSLAGSILDGTLDEEYPIMDKTKGRWTAEDEIREMDDYPLREDVDPYEYYAPSGNIDFTVDSDVVCKYDEDHKQLTNEGLLHVTELQALQLSVECI